MKSVIYLKRFCRAGIKINTAFPVRMDRTCDKGCRKIKKILNKKIAGRTK